MGEGSLAYLTYRGLLPGSFAGPLAKVWVLALVGYGLWQNRHLKSLYLVFLGLLLNTLVILVNGGHMPVSPEALVRVGLADWVELLKGQGDAVHALLTEKTRLPFLGDVIPLARMRKVISPGDVLILLGILGVVVEGSLRAAGGIRGPKRAALLRLLLLLALVLVLLRWG
ncbi:hypothetical protein THFILI_08670 [Thermus filiformis]|uniref:DUF5317 domain-containing protein n=1 Tax=Thermus filiformis TaxID=276 RepID=A0A0A2WMN2_THEFI|nr:hypothetical protein THFILI_08670 [Thermus filiformis]